VLITAAILNIAPCAEAQADREADHTALRALRDKVVTALDNQDLKALSSCFAKEFAFTTVNQTLITSEQQLNEFFARMFSSKDAIVTAMKTEPKADILTRFTDGNTWICYGSSKDTYTMKSGDVVSMNVRWTAVVVKENCEWKVAAAHVGADFLDNPVLDKVNAYWKRIAFAGAGGALLVGIFIGAVLFRRKRAV